ncbi:MAG: hypothetical protein JW719_14235, partial [Pirellulales bacterium]|nr:hypothetical protein [Pirellulales bacterium]
MEDVIVGIIVLVVGLISFLAQLANKQREQKAGGQRPAPPARPAAGPPAQGQQRPAQLEDEIAEFLRRAAGGRAAEARPARSKPAQARPFSADGPTALGRPVPARPAQTRPAGQSRSSSARPVVAEVIESAASRPVGGQLESAVAKDLDTSDFRQRAKQMGKEARQSTQELKQRVHQKFDHELSHLGGGAPPVATPVPGSGVLVEAVPQTAAAGFAAMLRDVD